MEEELRAVSRPAVTIACDIDGVIAPVDLAPAGCVELPRVMYDTHVLTRAVAALKRWHALGARVLWHSTWREPYTDELATTLTLPGFGTFASEEEFLLEDDSNTWWKLRAVQRWLREAPQDNSALLVWIDDDIADAIEQGEIDRATLEDPRLVVVSPTTQAGLTISEIEVVTSAAVSNMHC